MAGPYRDAACSEVLRAPTRMGAAELEVAPQHVSLKLGRFELSVTDREVVIAEQKRRKIKKRVVQLQQNRLLVARSWPARDLSLWHEYESGKVERLAGLPAPATLVDAGLAQLREFDRMSRRFADALHHLGRGVDAATEYGKGQHRVLELVVGETLAYFARPVFRERPRLQIEIGSGGEIVWRAKKAKAKAEVANRYGVVLSGDRIRFVSPGGDDLGRLFLPWISPEDREEITRRIQHLVDTGAPPPEFDAERAAIGGFLGLSTLEV